MSPGLASLSKGVMSSDCKTQIDLNPVWYDRGLKPYFSLIFNQLRVLAIEKKSNDFVAELMRSLLSYHWAIDSAFWRCLLELGS